MPAKMEIEKKFLVVSDSWKPGDGGTPYRQGYLSTDKERTVRVRLEGQTGKFTIKGKKVGASALEYDHEIPTDEAAEILDKFCIRPIVEKTRYKVVAKDGHVWDIDVFHGANNGLVVAEIELSSEGEAFERPEWLGSEVTTDSRYSNARLSEEPFSTWGK